MYKFNLVMRMTFAKREIYDIIIITLIFHCCFPFNYSHRSIGDISAQNSIHNILQQDYCVTDDVFNFAVC